MSNTKQSGEVKTVDSSSIRATLAYLRLIAFYLPQYHPIPENDRWWGKGFTEWTNVTKARPRFRGHYQPHLPADLGFCDLRLPEIREAQADLASEYGIHGFCYYHYWFNGERLLERPFNEVLALGRPKFPFCLCWANESWTRRWDGRERQVLMPQVYSKQDDLNHIRWLQKAFADGRYIRVEGKPLFLVYRPGDLPSAATTAGIWREEARKNGIGELFLCAVTTNFRGSPADPKSIGFDATLEFQPTSYSRPGLIERIRRKIRNPARWDTIVDYSTWVRVALNSPRPRHTHFRCLVPSWDNSPRRAVGSFILHRSSPEKYAEWLEGVVEQSQTLSTGEKIVFVNAWNEWAEGNHLEPCQRWGRAYLEATRAVLDRVESRNAIEGAAVKGVPES